MLERIKNWIIKIWSKHEDELEPENYKLSHDKLAKFMFNDILTIIPSLMLTEYNTISIDYYNTSSNRTYIQVFCNIFDNTENSEFQKERCDKKDYCWQTKVFIDKDNFSASCQQLIALREILNSITKKNGHYSQNEIDILMETALINDRSDIEKDVNNS